MEVCQFKERARCVEHKDRSGEVCGPVLGKRVGVFSLSRHKSESFSASDRASPLLRATGSVVWECQEGWWALKSPRIKVSLEDEKSLVKSGV